jgi:hypothetical protein
MRVNTVWTAGILLLAITVFQIARGQTPLQTRAAPLEANAGQIAHLLNLDLELQRLATLRAQRFSDAAPTIDELTNRQQILESVQVCTLQIDSVIAEIANEQSEISSLRTILQDRRDRKVNHLTTAALLVGSGLGVGASATQFTTLSNTTQNVGDAIAVGSGATSILLSILAARAQNGPKGTVENTPNMLGPLLGEAGALHTSYPPIVLQYLRSVPAGEDPSRGTRLAQLMTVWNDTGRLRFTDSAERDRKIAVLTASGNSGARATIDDLTDRIAMLGDVRGRVALMKRDLGQLVLWAHGSPR